MVSGLFPDSPAEVISEHRAARGVLWSDGDCRGTVVGTGEFKRAGCLSFCGRKGAFGLGETSFVCPTNGRL